ncbi:MAG: putative phosphoribosyl transferase [Solirubrobacteraceae bacterium]|jgi:dienelactone hydrolase|nr:putative phosphoribosyl transferase [Solirubrobacteraceae bacterium]
MLDGDLRIPEDPVGLVVFAHGSGSSRRSPRNRFVAGALGRAGLGTLLMDLLTQEEEEADRATGHLRFDIDLLGGRVVDALDWLTAEPDTSAVPVGLFGASTGAAAALRAAAARPEIVKAVVSRGGRPDLTGPSLRDVQAPTLLVVGARDDQVIDMNRQALESLRCEARLELVPGASHLFEEPGTLETAAELASEWFVDHLGGDA